MIASRSRLSSYAENCPGEFVMSAAISLLIILTLSIMVTRIAAVALRMTGVPDGVARFQARSAFTGAGFTTSESEAVVNYPIRRKIIGFLMLLGNLGFISLLGTVTVTFLRTDNETHAMAGQVLWLAGTLVLLWFIAINPLADKIMCGLIGALLKRVTRLGEGRTVRLIQIADDYSLASYQVVDGAPVIGKSVGAVLGAGPCLVGLRRADGGYHHKPAGDTILASGDMVFYAAHDRDDRTPFEPETN
jgi:hypothetical protein